METEKSLALNPSGRFRDLSLADIQNVAKVLFSSGIFKDTTDANIAFAKILAGQEMGLGPFASMQEISFISGKPSLSSTAKAAKIKESGKYDFDIVELDSQHCILKFYQNGKARGTVEYNEAMAKLSGAYNRNPNYKTNPDDMYFAGAIRKGQRRFAPDALNGIATYDKEELNEVTEAEVVETAAREEPVIGSTAPEPEKYGLNDEPTVTAPQIRAIYAHLKDKGVTDRESAKAIVYKLGQVQSTNDLTRAKANEVIAAIKVSSSDMLMDLLAADGTEEDEESDATQAQE